MNKFVILAALFAAVQGVTLVKTDVASGAPIPNCNGAVSKPPCQTADEVIASRKRPFKADGDASTPLAEGEEPIKPY